MPFQLVRLELTETDDVIARRPLQPMFELRDDAMAMAEFDASRCHDECEYDPERDCWRARDSSGRTIRFIVESVEVDFDLAA
jgi:hypothetical protein